MLKKNKALTAALAAATLVGGVAAASDAAAQGRYRRHDNTGAVVAAGIAGLALGAALSSGGRSYYAPNYGYSDYNRPYYAALRMAPSQQGFKT